MVLSGGETGALLEYLCTELRLCLPDAARARIGGMSGTGAETFARAVFDAEGLDPELPSNRRLFQRVIAVVTHAYAEAARTRLMWAVQALAQPADVQLRLFPEFVVVADELALELEDAWLLVQAWSVLDEAVYKAIQLLRGKLEKMSASGDEYAEDLWTPEGLRGRKEWAEVRALAGNACGSCGWPVDCPPLDPRDRGTTYVRAK